MTLFTRDETGKITTSCIFLDGELLDLYLSGDTLTDRGAAYEAIQEQTAHCLFPNGWKVQMASEVAQSCGVDYCDGEFSVKVEGEPDSAIIQVVNAMLLFYGIVVGACRIKETLVTEA
jgi:hypothetical protein